MKRKLKAFDKINNIENAKLKYIEASRHIEIINCLLELLDRGQFNQGKLSESVRTFKTISSSIEKIVEQEREIKGEQHKQAVAFKMNLDLKRRNYVVDRTGSLTFAGATILTATYPLIEIFNGKPASNFGIFIAITLGIATLFSGMMSIAGFHETIKSKRKYDEANCQFQKKYPNYNGSSR